VDEVVHAGGQLIVAPNLNRDVGKAAQSAHVAWAPGILSPTEAFAALEAGADSLKIFPAEMAPPRVVKAMRALLPVDAKLIVVAQEQPHKLGNN